MKEGDEEGEAEEAMESETEEGLRDAMEREEEFRERNLSEMWPYLYSGKKGSLPFIGEIKQGDQFTYAWLMWRSWRWDLPSLRRFVIDIFMSSGSIQRKGRKEAKEMLTGRAHEKPRSGLFRRLFQPR